jgi:small subunit ribosomal protein S17
MADPVADSSARVSRKNEKVGSVVSTKMTKTIVVEVSRRVPHPLYKRIINKRKKFYAHDEESTAKMGDVVRIIESRPLSKTKRWTLGEVVRKAVQVSVEPTALDIVPGAIVTPKGTKKKRRSK